MNAIGAAHGVDGSRQRRFGLLALTALSATLGGCGESAQAHAGAAGFTSGGSLSGGPGNPSSAGSSTGAGQAGSATGGNGSSGVGVGGSGVGGTAGSTAAVSVDCSGSFGAPTTLLTLPVGDELGSISLSPDELEVFYAHTTYVTGNVSFMRSTRASKDVGFRGETHVAELDALCGPTDSRGLDLSADGLRAYVVCVPRDLLPAVGQLHVLRRADLRSPFVADPKIYGSVGSSPAISHDELTLYTSNDFNPGTDPSRRYSRASTDAAFGSAQDIPGFETDITTTPEPAPDDLSLFMGRDSALVVSTRPAASAAFGAPTALVPRTVSAAFGSPDISQDCRTLYFVGIDFTEDHKGTYSLQVLRR